MNKHFLIMTVTALIMALGMSQSVMAKTITYLGHEYSGKVNDRNIPEGKGKITIGELIIKGDFSDKTINNATFETGWLKYNGVVEYSRENVITLKRGGIFTKYYYNKRDISITYLGSSYDQINDYSLTGKIKSKEETLSQDIKTDYESLEKEPFRFNYSFKAEGIPSELNPPESFNSIIKFSLRRYVTRNMRHLGINEIYAYVIDTESNNRSVVKNYKDDKDRSWTYIKKAGQDVKYSVTYPDSSQYLYNGSWVLVYPNKKNVFFNSKYPKHLKVNNEVVIKIRGYYDDINVDEFVKYQAEKRKIVLPSGVDVILSKNKKNLDSSALEQYLNNDVFALFQTPNPFEAKVYCTDNDNISDDDNIGRFSNGQFIPAKK